MANHSWGSRLEVSTVEAVRWRGDDQLVEVGGRVPVARPLKMVAAGMTVEQIGVAFPQIVTEDIHEALLDAAAAVAERELSLRHSA